MVRTVLTAVFVLGVFLVLAGCSKEAQAPKEEKAAPTEMTEEEHNKAMVRQHESMQTLQEEWSKARGALEKGKGGEAVAPAIRMEEAAKYQEEFMLHKNPERREEFLKRAREFKSLIMDFRQYAESGDVKSLKELAPEIDKACGGCHQTFR